MDAPETHVPLFTEAAIAGGLTPGERAAAQQVAMLGPQIGPDVLNVLATLLGPACRAQMEQQQAA